MKLVMQLAQENSGILRDDIIPTWHLYVYQESVFEDVNFER